ncbi:ABC transporter ATP-binding protein [Segetibacter aerophilus]|uniref:ABC transporter ATP-binding protein n=1 Tax=Segetibacter aerophilus TaxID=670293 RepID=A0A512BDG8_9BACT|nr:ABC transporter ATP-binding protein [Segetibacter aerophilus]GEO09935.1 ABC transporter ATP-binding protein [Segetibacter aerophilus]
MKFENSFIGYFKFYYRLTGKRLLINLALSITVSLLDGISLAMFMPLLQSAGGTVAKSNETLGSLHYITDFLESLGLTLNITTVLSILVVLFILKGSFKFLQLTFQVQTRHLFMKKIRYLLIDSLQDLSYKGFLKLDAGRIHNTLTGEVSKLFQSMSYYFNAAQNTVMLSTYILLAFLANFQFAILVALGAGLSNLVYRKIYKACKKIAFELSLKGNSFNSFLVQAIHNYKYLKSTNYLHTFSKKIKAVINDTEHLNRKIGVYNAITASVKEPLIIIVVAAVILIQLRFSSGNLTSILLSLLLFYRSLNFLMVLQNDWQQFIQVSASITTVSSIVNEMDTMKEVKASTPFQTFTNHIRIKNLVFAYGSQVVLNNIDVEIPKNKTIALVGESGSGKTTLANIVSGLIQPTTGEVLIDNYPLKNISLNSYRDQMGYISQEPVIFNDNIFNNITFWAEPTAKNIQKFWNIVELASLTTFITGLPQKELTPLGDNGMLVSGGQKQRISIARELYKDAQILILDEATSALDSETERVIQDNIDKLHGKFTILIIAHRLSTIKNADIIYLLDKGKVLAHGDFDSMLSESQRFKRMVSLQEM